MKSWMHRRRPVRREGPAPRSAQREGGFTLLETVVSLSILAAIAAFLAVAFRLAGHTLIRGEAEASDMARQRAVSEILEWSIRSAEPLAILAGETPPAPYFRGESGKLRFLTASAPVFLSGGGSRLVCFSGGGSAGDARGLVLSDASPMREAGVDGWEGTENSRILLPGASEVAFAYSSGPGEDGRMEWTDAWDGKEKKGLPAAVRVEYVVPSETGPLRTSFVVPVPAGGA